MTDAQNTPIITPIKPLPGGTRIILLRHGQTDWNIDHRFQGGTDIPLNDTGREQVRVAIDALQQARTEGTEVSAVFSSPLSRAVESGKIVAEGLNLPYLGAIEGFQERSFGKLEGQIATRELVLASREAGEDYGVEPIEEFMARALAALNRVRREYDGQTVLVATHGMFIALVMGALLGDRCPEYCNREGLYPIPPNASLTEVPLQYLDEAIDRLLVQHREPELGAEPLPAGAEKTTLTLIRHGQTDWNKANLMQGITDIPLNDTGREQARATGRKLADMGLEFTVLVSSPLSRAYETAQLVGEYFNLKVGNTYPELVERAYGQGEGLDIPAPERRAPERYYPQVESERDLYIRAVRVLRQIVREHADGDGQKIIAVSHGSLIRRALSAAAGKEWTMTVPNAEPLVVDVPGLFAWDSARYTDEVGRIVGNTQVLSEVREHPAAEVVNPPESKNSSSTAPLSAGVRAVRAILWCLTSLWCLTVASIVFAPVHVDDNEMGGNLSSWLDVGHAEGWLPQFVTYSSIEQVSNIIMFIPGGFLFALLLGRRARRHVLYAGFVVSACIETIQSFMPNRTGDPVDVLMNGSGALIGATCALWVHRVLRKRRERAGRP